MASAITRIFYLIGIGKAIRIDHRPGIDKAKNQPSPPEIDYYLHQHSSSNRQFLCNRHQLKKSESVHHYCELKCNQRTHKWKYWIVVAKSRRLSNLKFQFFYLKILYALSSQNHTSLCTQRLEFMAKFYYTTHSRWIPFRLLERSKPKFF